MTNLQLFELISDIDSSYIIAAARPVRRYNMSKWTKIGGVAACLCLIIAGIFAVSSSFSDRSPLPIDPEQTTASTDILNGEVTLGDDTVNSLPVLSIDENSLFGGAMGFEGLMYYDISEAENGNPWNEETELETLPVYKNLGFSYHGVQNYLESDEMVARVKETAELLGIEITDWDFGTVFSQIGENEFLDETTYAEGANADVIIRAFANGNVFINYEKARELPDSINFTHKSTTHEDGLVALEYLSGEYAEFMNYTETECITFNGNYNIYGEQGIRDYIIYEGSGDYAEDIINYNLNYTEFVPEFGGEQGELDTGNLGSVKRYDHLVCAEKVGDYPLISVDEAEKLLFSGIYLTSVPHDIVETDIVAKVELVYTKGVTSQYFMPVYKFYIPLSGRENGHNFDRSNGLITFGIYYVPAISGEYIADMPTSAGRFN